jgi:hypothetical protein
VALQFGLRGLNFLCRRAQFLKYSADVPDFRGRERARCRGEGFQPISIYPAIGDNTMTRQGLAESVGDIGDWLSFSKQPVVADAM